MGPLPLNLFSEQQGRLSQQFTAKWKTELPVNVYITASFDFIHLSHNIVSFASIIAVAYGSHNKTYHLYIFR